MRLPSTCRLCKNLCTTGNHCPCRSHDEYMPTLEEIAEVCAAIRSEWDRHRWAAQPIAMQPAWVRACDYSVPQTRICRDE